MGSERRVVPRINTSLKIAFSSSGVSTYSYMLNLSSGGIFIKTNHPLPIDAELEMSFQLPDDPVTMHISGRVVWTKPESHAFPAGMGVQFGSMPPEDQKKIQTCVESNLRKKTTQQCPEQAG